jgi:excisionase family DNA binding protein
MTTEEVAAYLRVPPRTVEAWRYKGTGPPGIRVGKHVRYRRTDVEAWLFRQMETQAVSPPSGLAKPLAQGEEVGSRRRRASPHGGSWA